MDSIGALLRTANSDLGQMEVPTVTVCAADCTLLLLSGQSFSLRPIAGTRDVHMLLLRALFISTSTLLLRLHEQGQTQVKTIDCCDQPCLRWVGSVSKPR